MLNWLAIVLIGLIGLLQYQLWLGDGGIAELTDIRARSDTVEEQNVPLRARNARLAAEVIDLQTGLDAIEERSRSDIGMVRADEQFYWVPGIVAENAIVEQRALKPVPDNAADGSAKVAP